MSTQNKTVPSWQNHPTPLELLVGIVSGKKSPEYKGATRAFTINIPVGDALLLDAMLANTTEISPNELICHLLDFALQEVRENLPEEINEKILQFVSVEMDSANDKLLKFK